MTEKGGDGTVGTPSHLVGCGKDLDLIRKSSGKPVL